MTVPSEPASAPVEPSAAMRAEIEQALNDAVLDDTETVRLAHAVRQMFHTVGADDLEAAWWPAVEVLTQSVDLENDHFADLLRDWIKGAADAMQHWLWMHDVPKLYITVVFSSGALRWYQLVAKAPR